MRHITVIRHGKSAWDDPSLTDFDRPLKRRGVDAARAVGRELARRGLAFDRVLCSPARRAVDTLALLREGLAVDGSAVVEEPDLYGAEAESILRLLAELPAALRDVALVGHNPGLEDLCRRLGGRGVPALKTACVARFTGDAERWSDLEGKTATLEWFLHPRELAG